MASTHPTISESRRTSDIFPMLGFVVIAENISLSSNRKNHTRSATVFCFVAKIVHIYVQKVGFAFVGAIPYRLKQLFTRKDLIYMGHEHMQQREFPGRQS